MSAQAAGRTVAAPVPQEVLHQRQGLETGVRESADAALRICFISPLGYGLYRPESGLPFGGAEVQLFLLAKEMAKGERRQVQVLTTVEQKPGTEMQGRVTVVRRRGLHRLEGPSGLFRRGWNYVQAFRDMYRQLRAIGADVYLHSGSGVEVGAYALICRLLRTRFVYVVASSADLDEPYGKVQGPLRWLYPVGLRLADAIVCRTEEQRVRWRERYGRGSWLIRTGHPIPEVLPDQPGAGSILWVGRAHPLKQPDRFLDLAERLPHERFIMVVMPDPAHPDLSLALRRRAAKLPQVTFHEGGSCEAVDGVFAQAKLFVNTSTYEGFPNTFVQAAMHRVPILSWLVNPDAVLTAHRIGACAEGSFERLVEEVQRFAGHDELRRETGERARRYAEAHHDVARAAETFDALLRQVVGQREAVS
ncbi:MAG: glycosyltransferase family 4 protein [Nitrospirota bacterium]|nr:glycosyltransferase family 4 protein [Nitrospirota bacterium]